MSELDLQGAARAGDQRDSGMSARLTWSESIGKFGKGVLALAMLLAVAQMVVALARGGSSEDQAEALAEAAGMVLVALLFPVVISFLAFHISRRGRWASTAGLLFGVVLALGSMFPAPKAPVQTSESDGMESVQQTLRDFRLSNARDAEAWVASDEDAEWRSEVAAMDRRFRAIEKVIDGLDGEAKQAMQLSLQSALEVRQPMVEYEAALQAVMDAGALDATGLLDFKALVERDRLYREFGEANQRLREAQLGFGHRYVARLEAGSFSPGLVAGARRAVEGNQEIALFGKIRDSDAALVESCLAVLKLLRDEHGYWHTDADGFMVFESDSAVVAYEAAMNQVDANVALQDKLLLEYAALMRSKAQSANP